MQRVIHASLNGNAFAIEEGGYERLRAYLDEAARQLAGDPDRDEIVADLEQAIAEKCGRHLGPHKTVVSAGEMERVLAEMGPVKAPGGDGPAPAPAGSPPASEPAPASAEPPVRRLYRVLEGAVLGGLCSGLGAYFRLDANLVRAIFVVLAVVTHGALLLVYLVLLFVVPAAGTPEERAAARGLPFSAQGLVEEAKRRVAPIPSELRDAWRHMGREWRSHVGGAQRGAPAGAPPAASYGQQVAAGVVIPVMAMLSAGITVAWLLGSASLLVDGRLFGWEPAGLPLWLALVILAIVAGAVGQPIHHARRALQGRRYGMSPLLAAWDGLLWLGFLALFAWLAWSSSAELRSLVHDLPGAWSRVLASLPSRG